MWWQWSYSVCHPPSVFADGLNSGGSEQASADPRQQVHGAIYHLLTLLVSIVEMVFLVCWQKNGNRFVSCLKWSYVTTYMCVSVCASNASYWTRSDDSHSTWTEPIWDQPAFVPTVGSLWQVFHFFLCQNADSMNAVIFIGHNKYTLAIVPNWYRSSLRYHWWESVENQTREEHIKCVLTVSLGVY